MKVLFLARAGVHVTWLAGQLEKSGAIDAVIFESGAPARQRKLRRHFDCSPLRWPSRVLDLILLLWIGRKSRRYLEKVLDPTVGPERIPVYECDDANDERATSIIREIAPDLILIYGIALLKRATLSLGPIFLNLHGGLVPKYRNVHSEFWALAEGRPEDVGSSILYVTPGIDSGPVAMQGAVDPKAVTNLVVAQALNIKLGARLAGEAVQAWRNGQLTKSPQTVEPHSLKPTPSWRDFWRHRAALFGSR